MIIPARRRTFLFRVSSSHRLHSLGLHWDGCHANRTNAKFFSFSPKALARSHLYDESRRAASQRFQNSEFVHFLNVLCANVFEHVIYALEQLLQAFLPIKFAASAWNANQMEMSAVRGLVPGTLPRRDLRSLRSLRRSMGRRGRGGGGGRSGKCYTTQQQRLRLSC